MVCCYCSLLLVKIELPKDDSAPELHDTELRLKDQQGLKHVRDRVPSIFSNFRKHSVGTRPRIREASILPVSRPRRLKHVSFLLPVAIVQLYHSQAVAQPRIRRATQQPK